MNKKNIFLYIIIFLVSLPVNAQIISQDPTGEELYKQLSKYSKSDFLEIKSPDIGMKQFLSGLMYLTGFSEYNIEKDCKKGLDLLENAWSNDIADAGYQLATFYYSGLCSGVDVDLNKSREYLEKSAESGYLLSEKMLGEAYLKCSVCKMKSLYEEKDIDKAIHWISKAADDGDINSAGELSLIYLNGRGVPVDKDKAFNWMYKAVHNTKYEIPTASILVRIAPFYEKGIGTEKNLVLAYKYYLLGGSSGSEGRSRIKKQMTAEQIEKGRQLAKKWMDEHGVYIPSY